MKLLSAQVQMFRNVVDSGEIEFEEDVTCLVGKNESGKTSVLQALHRFNPAPDSATFDALNDYPRWRYTQDRRRDQVDSTLPIRCTFELEQDDVEAIEEELGPSVLMSTSYSCSVAYAGNRVVSLNVDEAKALTNYFDHANTPYNIRQLLTNGATAATVRSQTAFRKDLDEAEQAQADALRNEVEERFGKKTAWQIAQGIIRSRTPRFFYFSQYELLPGRIDLRELNTDHDSPGETSMQTARALLRLAGADQETLTADEFDRRKAELEAVSNDLSREVFKYWTQSSDLSVDIDVDKTTENVGSGQTAVVRFLEVRVRDARHGFTGNFSQRSSGFQWFFSFLAAFSEFEDKGHGVIVLLDEPALNLHGRAQADFLRFINERLARGSQVIYTTHSPFMVEPSELQRVRIVEDKGPDIGSVVSKDVYSVGSESIFPLQAALGYDIAQNLFIGPDNLLLEGTSDFTYLQLLSDHLKTLGREGLSERWRIMQSAGATNMPTFVSLLGDKLDVTLLIDGTSTNFAKIQSLIQQKALSKKRLIVIDTFTKIKASDVEDMFTKAEYLKIYNRAFGTNLSAGQLVGNDRIIAQIGRAEGKDFTAHGKPADELLRATDRKTVLGALSKGTLDKFEALFRAVNATLSD
ncbi:putative ATPase [Mycobacterium sp. OAS707]|uniref:ATP-dependent nuclease n=1 Tax=Mycobacterium sp. OAS707 TaxID=2663822 RepID=UPI00178A0793|nr:AAA family ATPase [Mycobacterium sp. OAS707]MBE1551845.1 putative ATPase [Mycobacterium sp. OAS707]